MSDKQSLVIVESPAKAKTINKYLGKNYKVEANALAEFNEIQGVNSIDDLKLLQNTINYSKIND